MEEMRVNLPKRTEEYYELYFEFCEKILFPLFNEDIFEKINTSDIIDESPDMQKFIKFLNTLAN